jgi:transketolase N-terminal domain/subunit
MNKLELQKMANEVRKGIVTGVHAAKAGHPGGSLSAADLFTYLYFEEMNVDPKNPQDPDRDRFVLSKGHTDISVPTFRDIHVCSTLQDLICHQVLLDRESPLQ